MTPYNAADDIAFGLLLLAFVLVAWCAPPTIIVVHADADTDTDTEAADAR